MNSAAIAAAAAAARAAAQINLNLAARGVVVAPVAPAAAPAAPTLFEDVVDINHSRNRAVLTRGQTHTQIEQQSGASLHIKGNYRRFGATEPSNHPPLRIVSTHAREV